MARGVPKTYLRPVLGQKKLTFTSKEPEEDFAPIFGDIAEGANKEARARALQPGKKGTTRFMPSFPDDHKKLIDFRRYLMSVEGTGKSSKVAKETSSDISKILYHANRSELTWSSLTERARLLSFFERCSALGVGPEGRLSKMERMNDAFRYMRFCLHSGPSTSKNFTMLSDIDAVEQSVNQWKTVLRREKKRLNIGRNQRGGGTQRGGGAHRAGHRQRGGKANPTRDSPAFNQEQMKVLRDTISAGLSDLYESHRGPPQPLGTSSAHPPQHPPLREDANTDAHFQERAGPSGASH